MLIDQSSSAKLNIDPGTMAAPGRASSALALPRFCESHTLFRCRSNPQTRGIASHTRPHFITTMACVSRSVSVPITAWGVRET